ncbi:hypothetical protein KIM372_12480 [Bombiscardovia nodaiensis]|uniref:Transposase n=1 Tax=Bombiscardovia nodaiensis TaxID=2932181 RepID=A0ABM8B8Y1_9BIFI|nr:hypothetical protein KIM372_12480 [Bombiscardovia nodaiensis]
MSLSFDDTRYGSYRYLVLACALGHAGTVTAIAVHSLPQPLVCLDCGNSRAFIVASKFSVTASSEWARYD